MKFFFHNAIYPCASDTIIGQQKRNWPENYSREQPPSTGDPGALDNQRMACHERRPDSSHTTPSATSEDDILVTANGHEVMTAATPKTIADVEAITTG